MFCGEADAQTLIPQRSTWRYFKGTAEPSATIGAWRQKNFLDGSWLTGASPFYYGESLTGTLLSDMRSNYTTIYLRKTLDIPDPSIYDRLIIRTLIDDGWIIWINNKEVLPRFNVATGERAFNTFATANIEQTSVTNSVIASDYLEPGVNVIAAQVFNSTRTSTDLVFELQMDGSSDRVAPTIQSVSPSAGAVQQLSSITVNFSEPVQGVTAQDFLVNSSQATSVTGSGATYTFTFPQPAFGLVDITWEPGHQIGDFGVPPNSFDSTAASARWQYNLNDTTPPAILTVNPPNGSTIRTFSQMDIRFDATIVGIDATDLLVNGVSATGVITNGNLYTFQFPAQAAGAVNVTWAANHGIEDIGVPPNAFVPQNFSYTVDPNYTPPSVIISEFLAAAQSDSGRKDEDLELQDWIELYNPTANLVNLEGWSLTDDPEDPDLWLFPNITIGAGARLVVFASAKDRRPTTGNLHTNFKLNNAGEFLGLYNAESPRRAMTSIDFPEQRNDYSYGLDSGGLWQYFQTPTPGAANGTTTIVGLIPKLKPSVKRGTYDAEFDLNITNEVSGITIRYTTDGSEPTATSPIFSAPMRISTTTILRAVGFKANYLPSETMTESYIFLDQVIAQSNIPPPGFPVGPSGFSGFPADYEMDPEIVNSPEYNTLIKPALQALPVISIAIRPYDMWDASNGIYTHPLSRGPAWERPCSIEFFTQDGKGFQENAGIQIQGNAAREPIKTPKHPMRVVFKGDYGPTKLNFQMFPDSPLEEFDTLILRADFNTSWLHWDPTQRQRGQRIRDAWTKDSMREMGGLASHNRYAHLYINGIYWGIYEPTERPDGAFGAGYLGGKKADYDVMNEGAAVDGTITAYNQMLAISNLADLNQYNLMKTYLDMQQFIDYMLLHFYVGHEDWFLNKNWYALRPKDGSSGFKYVPWDGELIMANTGVNRVNSTDLPSGLHPKLIASPEYRLAFADRVQKHFFNGGALTPAQNTARFAKRSKEIELPIIAESARWGDYRRDVHQYQSAPYELYTRNVQWAAEQARMTNTYFPGRTATVLTQLRNAQLYPAINAPVFSQFGGAITPNFQLTITGTATIYYTTNGVDPRVYGTSAVSSDARAYAAPVSLNSSAVVKARSLSGTNWSALTEAVFSSESPRIPLRFTEIIYNADPPGDAFEYLEIQNVGALPLDVSGFYISGVDYIFPPQTTLAPGQIVLLGSSQNTTSFKARYPGVTAIGYFGGQLSNGGERIAIVRPDGRTVTSVDYDDEAGWAPEADGVGYSLEVVDPFAEANDPANWRASAQLKGTPGAANPARAVAPVIINEVYATSLDVTDFLELRSTTNTDLNIGGWTVWKVGNPVKYTFPLDTILPAGTYLVLNCDGKTNDPGFHAPFALDRDGETYVLSNGRNQRVDARTVGDQPTQFSSGLVNGKWRLTTPTSGADNSEVTDIAPASSLVINEWLSNPVPGGDDWLEIYNTHPTLVADLRGLFFGATNEMFEITRPFFVEPGGYIRLWADNFELDFKLPAEGETIRIYNPTGSLLHSVTYVAQGELISSGRFPNGTSTIIDFAVATPGAENTLSFPLTLSANPAQLRISWPSVVGVSYQVQSTSDVAAPNSWVGVQQITSSTTTPFYDIVMEPGATRFFRVVRQP